MASKKSGVAGSNRAFVARRFLNEDDDDDLEPGTLDLDDSTPDAGGGGGEDISSNTGGANQNLFDRRDNYEVDQTVNLMDTSAATYDTKRKGRHSRNRGLKKGGMQATSMVDVFLDYAESGGPGQRVGKVGEYRSRQNRCKDLVFSTRFLSFVVFIVVVALIAVFGVNMGGSYNNTKTPKSQTNDTQFEDNKNRLRSMQSFLAATGVTSAERLLDDGSPANKAVRWLTQDDPAALDENDPALLSRYIMAVLYHSTQPADSKDHMFEGWKVEGGWMTKADICTWYGIDCETIFGKEEIVHVKLPKNQLQGTLPTELTSLGYLLHLDLSNNALSGSMPEEIGKMTYMNFLILNGNKLTGQFPFSIGAMMDAEEIKLSYNEIEGQLPTGVGHLHKLRIFEVDHNKLTGSIPREWKQKDMASLHLHNNGFKGHIPHSLFQLTTLVDFRLGNNFLTGTVPPEIESIFKLEVFGVNSNQLHGDVPEVFDRLHHLRELNLHHNQFEGDLPKTLGKCSTLEKLMLDENLLTGSIPKEWGGMTNLHTLALHTNKLNGSIPTTLGNLVRLKEARFENNNKIMGSMPAAVCNLVNKNLLETLTANCPNGVACDCCTKCF